MIKRPYPPFRLIDEAQSEDIVSASHPDREFPYKKPFSTHVVPVRKHLGNHWEHRERNQLLRLNPLYANCTFMICNRTRKCAVVDPAASIPFVMSEVERLGLTVEKILLTHGHFDHSEMAYELSDKTGAEIWGPHKNDEYLFDNRFLSPVGLPHGFQFTPDKWLKDGDKISVGDLELGVLHFPGHTPGSVGYTYKKGGDKVSFVQTGDALLRWDVAATHFRGGSMEREIDTILHKIIPLGAGVRYIPGHMYGGYLGTVPVENISLAALADYQIFVRPVLRAGLKGLAALAAVCSA
jgi:glyoxylase-like metal-dependent hydrolase (beta-lactamase superfamily II)